MNIGDKVKFNKYLPLNEAGKYKKIIITRNEEQLAEIVPMRVQFRIWNREHNNGVSKFYMNKLDIPMTKGVYIGSIRKKLCRTYTATDSPDEIRRERMRREIERMREVTITDTVRPRNWTSRNPNRLDDPNKLDELAIIAVSKNKRYVVDMKDIMVASFNDKFKVL